MTEDEFNSGMNDYIMSIISSAYRRMNEETMTMPSIQGCIRHLPIIGIEEGYSQDIYNETAVRIKATEDDIVVRLYDDTSKHRDNFIKLVKEGFFYGTLFHRVIKDFMIQGGDPKARMHFKANA